jgi:hypothetical protein
MKIEIRNLESGNYDSYLVSRNSPNSTRLMFFLILACLILVQVNTFSQEYTMPSFVHAIDACDIDKDGSIDIVVSCAYEDSIVILFNDGNGNFDLNYYYRPTNVLICGCFDGDNIPDLITGTEGYLFFIKSNGDRSLGENIVLADFSGAYTLYSLIDLNSDGWNDLVYDYDTYWGILKNNGNLTLTNKILGSGSGSPAHPSVGFLNNDSLPDILVSYSITGGFQVTKYQINNSNFNFTTHILNDTVYTPVVSEMNNIFPNDLMLFYNPTPEVLLYENTGDATFISQGIHNTMNSAGVIFNNSSDYNQDGYDDFSYTQCFWTGCTDSLYVELNDQNWSFYRPQQYYIGTLNWFRIKSSDLNGDNFPDFYMTGYNDNHSIKILWNNGDGTFSNLNPVGIKENPDPLNNLKIEIRPNPFSSFIYISLKSISSPQYKISIVDIYGRPVKDFNIANVKINETLEINWDGKDYSGQTVPKGIYFLIVSDTKNYIQTSRLIKY